MLLLADYELEVLGAVLAVVKDLGTETTLYRT